MPSKDIFNYALGKIEKLDINLIAPQHGSIIEKKYIPNLLKDMKNLDCGLYIEEKYNRELIDTIKELQDKKEILKEREIQLLEQSKRAEIGEMIGNIAHQWRQPLAIINTSIGILKEKNRANLLSKREISEKLAKMEKRLVYMSDTIEDFMNYYKPNKGRAWFKVYKAIQKALDIVNLSTSSKKIKINLLVNTHDKIYGLINEFVQVIVSILSNINDIVISRNLSNVSIIISLLKDERYTILTIADNCGGIEEENLTKIFDPYFTTKHKAMGTGLGLHIAKMIIEDNMNGSLSAKNSNGGAKFIIKMKNEK
jgi:C4-dicarboxylate-specific signal transduction histidine kinase